MHHQRRGYTRWLQAQAANEAADRAALSADIAALDKPPLISVVMPVCDAPERWLRRAIDSVRRQDYPHWQLCIADDASTAPHVRQLLEAAAAADVRIRLVLRDTRGHICLATRSAMALADGDFITFLDHDDELDPLALARVVAEIGRYPESDLLYSDEDLIGTDGRRYEPYFKPDWNPELLRAQNYLCHLSVYRADLLRGLDAFRPEVEGSQDWDLALRAAEKARCIRHLPHILYHWRSMPGSIAHADTAKNYTRASGQHAVQAHLERCGETAYAELLPFGHLRVRHALPKPAPRISLIITMPPAGAIATHLQDLLRRTHYPDFEVLLASARPCAEAELPLDVRLVLAEKNGCPLQLLNHTAATADSDILCFADLHCIPADADWLETLASLAVRPGNGAVGARLLLPNDRIWHAGYFLDPEAVVHHPYRGAPAGFAGLRNRALLQQNVSAVSAVGMAVRKSSFEQVGGFDETAGRYADVDLCLKLQETGLRNLWTPHVTLHLKALPGTPDGDIDEDTRYMQRRWRAQLARDPAGNPNLVIDRGLPVPAIR